MDYAIEYSLMNELYDSRTNVSYDPALEFFGIDTLIEKLIKLIKRVIVYIIGLIKTRQSTDDIDDYLNKYFNEKDIPRLMNIGKKYAEIVVKDVDFINKSLTSLDFTFILVGDQWYQQKTSDVKRAIEDVKHKTWRLEEYQHSLGRSCSIYSRIINDSEDFKLKDLWIRCVNTNLPDNTLKILLAVYKETIKKLDKAKQQSSTVDNPDLKQYVAGLAELVAATKNYIQQGFSSTLT